VPADTDEMLTARRLEVLCDGVCDAVVLTFFERRRKHPSDEWMARQRRKIEGGVKEIARIVGDGEWAVGNDFGLGDIAAGTVAGYLAVRFPEFRWRQGYPNLAALSDRLEGRPSFRDSVPVPQTIRDAVV
jgi:glutathione S-transferase